MLEQLSQIYILEVSELAGARHGINSRHYAGIAVDIIKINGRPVNAGNPYYRKLMINARQLGATEVLGPGTVNHGGHIHLGLSRILK
jgi:hypothetical protein